MGMFNTIEMPCPKCGKMMSEQDKPGDGNYNDLSSPVDLVTGINVIGSYIRCRPCNTLFELESIEPLPEKIQLRAKVITS
jgi:phage FluMu protein Com